MCINEERERKRKREKEEERQTNRAKGRKKKIVLGPEKGTQREDIQKDRER